MFLQFAYCCYSPALLPVAAVFGHSRYSVLFSALCSGVEFYSTTEKSPTIRQSIW